MIETRPANEPEALQGRLFDSAPACLAYCELDGRFSRVNQARRSFTGDGAGCDPLSFVHPDDRERIRREIEAALVLREPFTVEYRLRRHDGVYRWMLERGQPCLDEQGICAGYACAAVEVHGLHLLRRMLTRRQNVLRRQRLLLTELRHRTKNTLQLIGSLLSLLSHRVSKASMPAVREMARRVHAFSLAHAALDASPRVGTIDLGRYLGELAQGLLAIGEERGVRLTTQIEPDIQVGMNRAVPLGLIVNELVTNALKHSFPGGRAGEVRLQVRRDGPDQVEIVVADNGIGLPEGTWPPRGTESLGLPLVTGLARQAEAEVAVTSGSGTRFAFTFASSQPRAAAQPPSLGAVAPA